MIGSDVLQYCILTIAVSFTAVVAVGAFAMVLGILCVIFGKDKDN